MSIHRIIVKRALLADMHVRINETGNQEAIPPVHVFGMRASDKTWPNLCDTPVANSY
jgi:hypothetical protein